MGLEEGSIWFDNVPIGVNKIGELMKQISNRASLSEIYTNHSVSATFITIMFQGGVDTNHICKVTKHKIEESLKHCIDGQSLAQKLKCSDVLSSAFSNPSSKSTRPVMNRPDPSASTPSVQSTIARPVPSSYSNPYSFVFAGSVASPLLPQYNSSLRADVAPTSTQTFSVIFRCTPSDIHL